MNLDNTSEIGKRRAKFEAAVSCQEWASRFNQGPIKTRNYVRTSSSKKLRRSSNLSFQRRLNSSEESSTPSRPLPIPPPAATSTPSTATPTTRRPLPSTPSNSATANTVMDVRIKELVQENESLKQELAQARKELEQHRQASQKEMSLFVDTKTQPEHHFDANSTSTCTSNLTPSSSYSSNCDFYLDRSKISEARDILESSLADFPANDNNNNNEQNVGVLAIKYLENYLQSKKEQLAK